MNVVPASLHGSPKGYELGCRSKGGCPHHRDPLVLTCAEAAIAVRGDRTIAALPVDRPIPRLAEIVTTAKENASDPPLPETHGTVWRYRQGCTDARRCPHWRLGRLTCPDARRRYFAEYHARRRSGSGTPITHGTSGGYLSGCTSADMCPRDEHGRSCHQARAEYRRRRARAQGISAPTPRVVAREAAQLVVELTQRSLTLRAIARMTGVGRSTIARILTAHEQDATSDLLIHEATLASIRAGFAEYQSQGFTTARPATRENGMQ